MKQNTSYRASLVKSANERLRKIEKVYNATNDSNVYVWLQKQAVEYPNTTGKFLGYLDEQGNKQLEYTDRIRFLNKSDFEKLTDNEKSQYNQMLDRFLESNTSTKIGIDEKYRKAMQSFNEENKYQFDNVEDYKKFWDTYNNMVESDQMSKLDSDTIWYAFENIDIPAMMNENKIEKALRYLSTGKWSELDKLSGSLKHQSVKGGTRPLSNS